MWIQIFLVFVVNMTNSFSQKSQWEISCKKLSSSTTPVELNTSFSYTFNFSHSEFCVINNTNLKITSNGEGISIIQCGITNSTVPNDSNLMTGGIAFINSTVEIERVSFVGCGTYLDFLPQHMAGLINDSSTLKYSSDLASALVFVNCKMKLVNVTMNSSFGFAMIGLNIINAVFFNCCFSSWLAFQESSLTSKLIGSGVIIHFTQQDNSTSSQHSNGSSQITFNECQFRDNWMYISPNTTENSYLTQDKFVSYAAGLTIIYEHRCQKAIVTINYTLFDMNFGPSSLLIKHQGERSLHSRTILTYCRFLKHITSSTIGELGPSQVFLIVKQLASSNLHMGRDSSLLPRYTMLVIKNSLFCHDDRATRIRIMQRNSRALRIDIDKVAAKVTVKLDQVTCLNNTISNTGVCVYMRGSFRTKVTLMMDGVNIANNTVYFLSPLSLSSGIITLKSVTCLINKNKESAQSKFKINYGVAIDAEDTTVKLSGKVLFEGNMAINGPAITVKGNSRVHFMEHSEISFIQNKALKLGGAIHAVVSKIYKHCAFSFSNGKHWTHKILFVNNSAKFGGNSIYASPLFNCSITRPAVIVADITTYYNVFNFSGPNKHGLLDISTIPETLQVNQKQTLWVYPGQEYPVCLTAKDSNGRNVHATVNADFTHSGKQVFQNEAVLYFSLKHQSPKIQESNTCTNLTVSVYSTENPARIPLLFYLKENQKAYKQVIVNSKQCPLGFELHSKTGYCECSRAMKQYSKDTSIKSFNCNITTQSYKRHHYYLSIDWAGTLDNDGTTFGISPDCSFGLCKTMDFFNYFYSNSSDILITDLSQDHTWYYSVCVTGRKGPLCGKCEDGLSVVLGSTSTCQKCNSYERYWVVTIITLIAGPLLVLLLFVLKLTLTVGTINGIIFYVNIIYTGSLTSLLQSQNHYQPKYDQSIAINFISLLNFKLSFPVCFFNNMDQLDKVSLGILVPYYLLLIVIIIIIISRYSIWLSNKTSHSSLQVLVTVVHISFSTLLGTCAEVFSSATIYTNHKGMYRVWKYDGSIEFLKHPRHILFTIGLSLAVLPLITAYLLFLIFSKYLLKCSWKHNLKVRHVYEAIHAPYKEGRQYWFTIRLLLLTTICFLPIIDGNNINFELTAILILLITVGHVIFPPYKSRALNILDAWILLLLCAIYIRIVWIHRMNLHAGTQSVTNSINVVLLTFIGVIVYHILKVTKLLDKIKVNIKRASKRLSTCCHFQKKIPTLNINADGMNYVARDGVAASRGSGQSSFDTCKQYREPAIGDD